MTESEHTRRKANSVRYFSFQPETKEALVRVLSRVPRDALEFAIHKCVFLSSGGKEIGLNGQCLPTRFIGEADWLILIYDDAPDIETVIAHELAHAYLGHSLGEPMSDEETEAQAREQTRAWGFTGKGADF
jgi:hypothetical protein